MNPIHNRRRLTRRIWKRLFAGYFSYVVISYGEGKDFKKIEICKENKGYVTTIHGCKVTQEDVEANIYKLLVNEIRKADDVKCFGKKFVTKEWNALNFMKAYSYEKLAFCSNNGCYIVR